MASFGYDFLKEEIDNPAPQLNSPSEKLALGNGAPESIGDRYVIVMVGLPATGKTLVARRLCQYLRFFHGTTTKSFNVGNYRRKEVGAKSLHSFFDPSNADGIKVRKRCAEKALTDLEEWLVQGDSSSSRVAVYDASNITRERRQSIMNRIEPNLESSKKVIFVECVLTDAEMFRENILETMQMMPDYVEMDKVEAEADFDKRLKHYRSVYESLETGFDESKSWVKIVNGGRNITMNSISGFLPGRIVQFLMNMHTTVRPIYLSRHGESEYNRLGKIGGDSVLSPSGEEYAKELAKYVHTEILNLNEDGSFPDPSAKYAPHARLFTSSLRRTKLTARHITHEVCDDGWTIMRPKVCSALDEIYAGVFDGMTYGEIEAKAPNEFEKRKNDKLGYRYPRGESYLDVIQRLDAIVHEVQRQHEPVLIVGHQGILRILYSYFMGDSREDAPYVSIPLNHVIKLEPRTYECKATRVNLSRNKGKDDDEPPSH